MGNIQSTTELDQLLTSFDTVSGTYDIIVTYAISHLIPKYMVEEMAKTLSGNESGLDAHETELPCITIRQSGSRADGLYLTYVNRDSLGSVIVSPSDVDELAITFETVSETLESAKVHNDGFYLDVAHTYPGYAQMIINDDSEYAQRTYLSSRSAFELTNKYTVANGPALCTQVVYEGNSSQNCKILCSSDFVEAYPIREWPSFVRESVPEVFHAFTKKSNQSGFYLVPVAHPWSEDPHVEWRISTSRLESFRCSQLTTTQRQVYLAFKYLTKEATKEHEQIKSYYMKTVFFWVLETSPVDAWCEENLAQCLYMLLDKLIAFLTERNLPHYFIPENNLVEHLSEEEIMCALDALHQVRTYPIGHIMQFQKHARLLCHCTLQKHCFEKCFLPECESLTQLLDIYKKLTKIYFTNQHEAAELKALGRLGVIGYLDVSMQNVCVSLLNEGLYDKAYETLKSYNGLSKSLMSFTSSVFQESLPIPETDADKLYRFIMYIGKFNFTGQDSTQACMTLLKLMNENLEQTDPMIHKMTQRLQLAEAALSAMKIQAILLSNEDEAEIALDQCSVAFDYLFHEHKDVVTVCEYLCFLTNLWHSRSSRVGLTNFISEARKFIKVTQTLVSAVELNTNGKAYKFHGVWKMIHISDGLEPNLTNFLRLDRAYEIPHEIVSLLVAFLTIHRTLVPTAQAYLSKIKQCSHCESLSDPYECECSFIGSLKLLVTDMKNLQYIVEKLFYETVSEHLSHPEVLLFHDTSCVLFLLSLVRMYSGDWKGALVNLPSIGHTFHEISEEKHAFAQRYADICRLVILYNLSRPKLFLVCPVGHFANNNENVLLPNGSLYNISVDMATYGFKNLPEHKVTLDRNGDVPLWKLFPNKIVVIDEDGIKTLHDRKTFDEYSSLKANGLTVRYLIPPPKRVSKSDDIRNLLKGTIFYEHLDRIFQKKNSST